MNPPVPFWQKLITFSWPSNDAAAKVKLVILDVTVMVLFPKLFENVGVAEEDTVSVPCVDPPVNVTAPD